jgi:hypothetical protein
MVLGFMVEGFHEDSSLTFGVLQILGTGERQLEAILQPALRHLITVRNFPRCVVQVTLQVMETPENAYVNAKVMQPRLVSELSETVGQ